jgi:hypothetical protein
MKHAKWLMPLLVAILLAGWFLMSTGTSARASATATPGAWSIVASPNPSSSENTLLGVAAVSASDVWAVGYYRTNDTGVIKALM